MKSYQYDSVTWFLYVLTEFCMPQVPSRLNWANWRNWRPCICLTTNLPVLHPSSLGLCRIWRRRLALRKPYRTSRIGRLVYCMFLPSFLSEFRATCVLLRNLTAYCGVIVLLFACRYRRSKASVASGTSELQHSHRARWRPRLRLRLILRLRPWQYRLPLTIFLPMYANVFVDQTSVTWIRFRKVKYRLTKLS